MYSPESYVPTAEQYMKNSFNDCENAIKRAEASIKIYKNSDNPIAKKRYSDLLIVIDNLLAFMMTGE